MKQHRQLLLLTLASPLLLASGQTREKVSFAPAAGASLTKTFSVAGKFELDDMQILMNGQENEMMPQMEMTIGWDQVVKVVDQYVELADGRPGHLTRRFEDIGQDIEMDMSMEVMGQANDQNMTGTGTSQLEGKTVVFRWDEGSEEFSKSFGEGSEGGDVALLEGLVEDMDLRMLLPADDVSEGDEWNIPLDKLIDLFAPGGDLKLDIEMEGADAMNMGAGDPETMSNLRDMFGDSVRGTAVARYTGMREVGGAQCGVIELTLDIESANDLTDKMLDMMEQPPGVEIDLESVDMQFTFEGTGELLWDLRGGHAVGFDLQGDVSLGMDMAMSVSSGQEMSFEMSMDMSGTVVQKLETE